MSDRSLPRIIICGAAPLPIIIIVMWKGRMEHRITPTALRFPVLGQVRISPASAEIQIPRIAKASGLDEEKLREIVKNNTSGKLFGIFGEETVNVLKVNIEIAKNMGIL